MRFRRKPEPEPEGCAILMQTTVDGRPFTIYTPPGGATISSLTADESGRIVLDGKSPSAAEIERGWMWAC